MAERLAEAYLALPVKDRAETGLITFTNEMRRAVTLAIQAGLRETGALAGAGVDLSVLSPHRFTRAEAGEIGSYRRGDIVVSPVAIPGSRMTAHALYTVDHADIGARRLHLRSETGEPVTVDLRPGSKQAGRLIAFK